MIKRRIADIIVILAVVLIILYSIIVYRGLAGSSEDLLIETLLVGIFLTEATGLVVYYYFSKRVMKEEAGPLRNLFRILAYTILILILLAELQINITGLLVAGGFLGIVLGLAGQSTISNFISGIYLLSSNAFEPGDRVIIHTWQYVLNPPSYPHDKFIPGFSGTIKKIGVLYTEFSTEEGLPMLIPNNIVAQALVINYHRAEEHKTRIQFDVDIRIKFPELEKRIKEVMKKNRVDEYNIDIEYLNNNLYVVTVRLKVEEKERTVIKTKIYTELIRYLNLEHKKLHISYS